MTKQEYADYEARVAHYLDGLEFVSTGACPGCDECGLGERICDTCEGLGSVKCVDCGLDCPGAECPLLKSHPCPKCKGTCNYTPELNDSEVEDADEPHFSWSSCEVCGSHLGGDRHPWHARTKDGSLIHGTCCSDCLYYLNYGTLDDTTMLSVEESTT
jgi:hypothetical protein